MVEKNDIFKESISEDELFVLGDQMLEPEPVPEGTQSFHRGMGPIAMQVGETRIFSVSENQSCGVRYFFRVVKPGTVVDHQQLEMGLRSRADRLAESEGQEQPEVDSWRSPVECDERRLGSGGIEMAGGSDTKIVTVTATQPGEAMLVASQTTLSKRMIDGGSL